LSDWPLDIRGCRSYFVLTRSFVPVNSRFGGRAVFDIVYQSANPPLRRRAERGMIGLGQPGRWLYAKRIGLFRTFRESTLPRVNPSRSSRSSPPRRPLRLAWAPSSSFDPIRRRVSRWTWGRSLRFDPSARSEASRTEPVASASPRLCVIHLPRSPLGMGFIARFPYPAARRPSAERPHPDPPPLRGGGKRTSRAHA
jgi:hypothetical protein